MSRQRADQPGGPTRFWRLILACTALVVVGGDVCAQTQEAPTYFHHQVWSTEEGLPQASVHAILQSHEGYLWIATEGGVARFDGQSFRVFNHATQPAFASDDVSCLAEDGAGSLWFGTADTLIRLQGNRFTRFSEQDGLPSSKIVALAVSSSGLLVLTTSGLAAWEHDRFKPVVMKEDVTGLSATPLGPMVVTRSGAVYRWVLGQPVGMMPATPAAAETLGVAARDERATWTFGSTFVQVSLPKSQRRTWRTGHELKGSRVQTLYVDSQGKAWIGTNQGLMSVEATPGSRIQIIRELLGESILSIDEDREGDLWAGTEASGLHVLQPRKFAAVPGSGPEAVTTVVRSSGGAMYFGTRDGGLYRSAGQTTPVAVNKLTSPVILSLAAGRRDDLWVGTPDGLNHITDAGVRHWTISEGLPDNFVRSVTSAGDGTAWAGTRFGLVHLGDDGVRTFTVADGLRADSIGPLLQVSSKESGAATLWIGTSAGLCRQANLQFQCLPSPYGDAASVTALGADHAGSVWVASHGEGLAMESADRMLPVRSPAIPAEILGILADQSGSLWLRGRHGLYRAGVTELRECALQSRACNQLQVEAYGRSDGLPSDEVAAEGMPPEAEGPNGELWFATRRGIAVTDDQHFMSNVVRPGVVMTMVQVDGADIDLSVPADVGPGHRQYSFDYTGLSFSNAGRTHYRYMLEGFDHDWVDAGSRRTANYTNLPPRRYVFRVMAANGEGFWSTDEATFHFEVEKPWYRSWWTYLAAVCLAVLVVFAVVQLRVRTERRRFSLVLQERNRVAREVHDTLAQDLVSVSLQVDIATQHAKAGRLEDVAEQLAQTRSLVRQALDSARQSIWNLRANLPDESLPVRLSTRVKAFRNTHASARLRIGGAYRAADSTLENEVMRVASEAISNVERHAGATEMLVELAYTADSLRLQVRDNGRGFDYREARALAGHYGLQGLEERAAMLQGQLSVKSEPGQGTTVTLIAPLPAERV